MNLNKSLSLALLVVSLFSFNVYAESFSFGNIVLNDSKIAEQWYLKNVNLNNSWNYSTGNGVTVAVIDSGVDIDHIDLRDNIWKNIKDIPNNAIDDDNNGYVDDINGWNFVDNDNNVKPNIDLGCVSEKKCSLEGINHGTVIAGVISAMSNNNEGIAGISFNSKIMPLKVLDSSGGGNIEDVINAINYAKNNGANIINMSFVGTSDSALLRRAMQDAMNKGIIFVVAAGNNPKGGVDLNKNPLYPICSKFENPLIIGVSAIDQYDKRANFANYGNSCVSMYAPGTSIFSTTVYKPDNSNFNNYYNGYWSGTSVATPIITSAVSLIKAMNPNIDGNKIIKYIISNADILDDGGLKLNVYRSIKAAYDDMNKTYDPRFITSSNKGAPSLIRLINDDNEQIFSFSPYSQSFKGGVNIVYSDVNFDSKKEIISSPASSGGPHVKVFDSKGYLLNEFFAYDKNFRGGVMVSASTFDGSFSNSLVTTNTANTDVRVFDGAGNLKSKFFAYDKNLNTGLVSTSCDLDNNFNSSIVVAPIKGGPQIKVFNAYGKLKTSFFAYNKNFRGGVSLSCADINSDGSQEIITYVLDNGTSIIRIFDKNGKLLNEFSIKNYKFGSNVNIFGKFNAEKNENYIYISSRDNYIDPYIYVYDLSGNLISKIDIKDNKGFNFSISY